MATPKWFDANAYMQNKLAQLKAQDPDAGWTLDKLYDAFREAGFVGAEGQYEHFVKFGAAEEVAPNAYFNANEYYAAKAHEYYGDKFDGSEVQIATVKAMIKDAGMNAWTHYQQFGSAEGVNPSNAFDASAYCAAKAETMNNAGQKAPDGTEWTAEKIADAIADAGMSVLEHYLTYAGTGEGEVTSGATYPVVDDDQVVVPNPGVNIVVDEDGTIYNGTAGDDSFYVKQYNTLQVYHTLDGGEGNDTLFLDDQVVDGTIKNIENLVVRSLTGEDKEYDLSAFSTSFTLETDGDEATRVTVNNVTDQKLVVAKTAAKANTLVVNMAAGQASVDLTSQNRDNTQTFTLQGNSLTSVKLAVDEGARGVYFTNSAVEVTDLAVTATVSEAKNDKAIVSVAALDDLVNVSMAGAGAVDLRIATTNAALKTVDATANTGGVTVDLSKADNAAFTGGAGADMLTVNGSKVAHTLGAGDDTVVVNVKGNDFANLAKGFSVDGGEGTDTLEMSAALAVNFETADVATNFEILKLVGSTVAGINTVNLGKFGDIDHVAVGALSGGGASLALTNMGNGGLLEYVQTPTKDVTVSVKDADMGKTDVLNVTIANNAFVTAGKLNVANVETINITADDTNLDDNVPVAHTMSLIADKATAVNISGNTNLTLTLTGSNAITKIDASGNTGGLTVDLKTDQLKGVTVTGSSAADDITMGIGNVITGGEGKDIFTATGAEEANAVVSYSTIMDFKGGDKLVIGNKAGVMKFVVTEEMAFGEAVNAALEAVGDVDTAEAAWFEYKGNTYVVAGTNNTFAVNDYLVKLNGIVDLSEASLANGILSLPEGA